MAQDNRATAINERLFGGAKIDQNAAVRGWELGKDRGKLQQEASPIAFINTAIDKYKSSQLGSAELDVAKQKARAAGIQRILTEGFMPNAHPEAKKTAQEIAKALQADPMFAQAVGLDPSKDSSGGLGLLFQTSGSGEQGTLAEQLSNAQKNLPEGVSAKVGGYTLTGTKIGATQRKDMSDASGTEATIDRVINASMTVPDIGSVKKGGILSALPRGMEGRAREWSSKNLTAGEGGGLTGLKKQEEEKLRTYMSNLGTNGGAVYKALSGDSGRLSDFDLERGMNLMWRPDLGETTAVRDQKNKILKEAIVKRKKAISQGRYYIDPETGAIMTPEIFDEAIGSLSGNSKTLQELGLDPNEYEIVEE